MRLPLALLLLSVPALTAETPKCPPPPTHISFEAADFSAQPGVTFRLRHFTAMLVPRASTAPFCYQKMTVVSRAEIFVDNASLTTVFTAKLGESGSKIKDFKVQNGDGTVRLSGKITKIIPIDFIVEGPISTDGTSILLNATKIKADGIPIKALLDIVGQHLGSVLSMGDVGGVVVKDNTISFNPEQIAHLKGRLLTATAAPSGLTLRYGRAPRR